MRNDAQRPTDDFRAAWLREVILCLSRNPSVVHVEMGELSDHSGIVCIEHRREAQSESAFVMQAAPRLSDLARETFPKQGSEGDWQLVSEQRIGIHGGRHISWYHWQQGERDSN